MSNVIEEVQLDFNDVLLRPKRSTIESRSQADVIREYKINTHSLSGTGIFNANMATTGKMEVALKMLDHFMFATLHKHYSVDELFTFFSKTLIDWCNKRVINSDGIISKVFVSIGLRQEDWDKLIQLNDKLTQFGFLELPSICIDVPNGYIPSVKKLVIKTRNHFPNTPIMVGNVVTGDITEDLILSGANIVKVGIGPGSVCLTRRQTGVGRPQLSTILECADAAHGVGGMICADGGVVYPGDICKAFAAGADFVMLGGFYAGTEEAADEIITRYYKSNEYELEDDIPAIPIFDEKKSVKFYGMSSKCAQEKHYNGMPKYRASEGREVEIPYTGSMDDKNVEILGSLRSMMTYIGARRLKDIPKCATFYKVNRQLNTVFEGK